MKFDQHTNDYTATGFNSPPSDRQQALAEAAYIRLMTPRGAYFDDANLGSELHKLKRSKDVARIHRQVAQWTKQALEPLTQPYYLKNIAVSINRERSGYIKTQAVLTQSDNTQAVTSINIQVSG